MCFYHRLENAYIAIDEYIKNKNKPTNVVYQYPRPESKTINFTLSFEVYNGELWEWADSQNVATIKDIKVVTSENGFDVVITPQYDEDIIKNLAVLYHQDFCDYFAERVQQ